LVKHDLITWGYSSFGNFVNRALKFVSAKYDGEVPDGSDIPGALSSEDDQDHAFITEVNTLLSAYLEAMDSVKLRLGLQTVMQISARGNLYLQQSGLGNALLADDPKRCAQVVNRALNLIYLLSAVVYPFMPATSEAILSQLNAPARAVPDVLSQDILPGHKIGVPAHLFKRIDEKQADIWRQRFGGETEQAAAGVGKGSASKKKRAATGDKTVSKTAKVNNDAPKSEAVLELEAQIKTQGDIVRILKDKQKKQEPLAEAELSNALTELLRLKAVLTQEQAKN
jgi:methionyl-tRNA synthetase